MNSLYKTPWGWGKTAGVAFSLFLFAAIAIVESSTSDPTFAAVRRLIGQTPGSQDSAMPVERPMSPADMERIPGGGGGGDGGMAMPPEFRSEEPEFRPEEHEGRPERREEMRDERREENRDEMREDRFQNEHPSADDRGGDDQGGGEDDSRRGEEMKRHYEESRRDLGRRRDELSRNFRNSTVDTSAAAAALSAWENALKSLESYINNDDADGYWNAQQAQGEDARRAADEAFQSLYQQNESFDMERTLNEKRDRLREQEREMRRHERDGHDASALKGIYDNFKSCADRMESLTATSGFDRQDFWDMNEDCEDIAREFWQIGETLNKARENEDLRRWLDETSRNFRHIDGMLKEVKREGGEELFKKATQAVETMKGLLAQAENHYQAGSFEEGRIALEELNDQWRDLDEMMEGFRGEREKKQITLEIENISREIKQAQERLNLLKERGTFDAGKIALCQGYVDRGGALLGEVKSALAAEDPKSMEDAKWQMEELGMNAERDCGEMLDNGPDVDSFKEVYIEKNHQEKFDRAVDRVADKEMTKKVLEILKSHSNIVNDLLEESGEDGNYEADVRMAQALEAVSVAPEAFREELLSRKAEMLREIKEMESLAGRLREARKIALTELDSLKKVQDEIAGYNFIGDAGDAIQQELQAFAENAESLSEAQIKARVKVLQAKAQQKIGEARQEKFEQGLIGFMDADDNQWFGKYALMAKQAGLVKGTGESEGRELNPEGVTNMAEAVTMFGRAVGSNEGDMRVETSAGRRLPEWAKSGAAALEKRGVNLDEIFGNKNAGDAVTRAEVARLMQKTFDLKSGDASGFSDTAAVGAAEKTAISAVNAAGIMTGEGDGTRFNPKGALNRAAMVKVLIKAAEKAGITSPGYDRQGITSPGYDRQGITPPGY